MPTELTKLFDSDSPPRSRRWNQHVFVCAYGNDGPLRHVVDRLQAGHSVLLYVHGSCMRPAAEAIKDVTGRTAWRELGLPSRDTVSLEQIWSAHASLVDALLALFDPGQQASAPQVIVHNLDLLANGYLGIDAHLQAKTALLYLAECTRTGVVLGLSDLAAGDLPDAIRRHFDEQIRLDAIPFDRFARLIPRELGERLSPNGPLDDMTSFLLASRLRWTEPSLAVRIMSSAAARHDRLDQVLGEVTYLTRSAEFDVLPPPNDADGARDPCAGYELSTIAELKEFVVTPFRRWLEHSSGDPRQALRRLPQGLIFHGPPGTGKSRLARWLAGAVGLPVRQIGATDLKRADWGLTERLVRDLFRSARRAAPCMIVLDDADDLLPDRETAVGGTASAERGVVNAFLQEIEGFGAQLDGVLVVLTTNRLQSLDSAARSRLPLDFHVPYPLTRDQVRGIVQSLAGEFGATEPGGVGWPSGMLDDLSEYFFRPKHEGGMPAGTDPFDPEARRQLHVGLFSPRDIATAMRMLCARGRPDQTQVERMKRYFDGRKSDFRRGHDPEAASLGH